MANYAVTVADIEIKSANTRVRVVQCGEAITQGQTVYQSSSDQKYYKADSNDTEAKADVKGIIITKVSSADGYGVLVEMPAKIDLGGTAAVGETYYQSQTAGEFCPDGDVASNDYVTRIGFGEAADTIKLDIDATGIQHA